MVTLKRWIVAACLSGMAIWMTGCGGGASTTPTVTTKSSKKEKDSGADSKSASQDSGSKSSDTADAPAKGGFGTFTGRVVFKGQVPQLKPLVTMGDQTAKDPAVCAAMDVPDESLLVSSDGGVANVFVYLSKAPSGGKKVEPASEPVVFDQKWCQFKPHALWLPSGQTMLVLNDDAVLHNTHTYPKANDGFNKAVQPSERKGIELVYEAAEKEPVQVKCDIHPFMIAWQLPMNHPYVAVTDKDGKFEIKDLPSGNHEFVVWHERPKYIERKLKIAITADQTTEKELTYDAEKFSKLEGAPSKVVYLSSRH